MPFLFFIEIAFQLPVSLYSVYRLGRGSSKGTTGVYELLLLVYAFETAFSTMLCMNHVVYLDPADFTREQRDVFWYQLMGPWVAVRKSSCCPVPYSQPIILGPPGTIAVLKRGSSTVDICGHVLEALQPCLHDQRREDEEPVGGIVRANKVSMTCLRFVVSRNAWPRRNMRSNLARRPALVYTRKPLIHNSKVPPPLFFLSLITIPSG